MKSHRLPDLLKPGLRLIFVGTAAGAHSAAVGAYYARPGNKFWPTLHAIGLTPHCYAPHEFAQLLDLSIGLTDVSKIGAGMDHAIAPTSYDAKGFLEKVAILKPRGVAFTSKMAAAQAFGLRTRDIEYGRQRQREKFPACFVLPSPSGAAGAYWSRLPWDDVAAWYRQN